MAAADAARELLRRRLDEFQAWWRMNGRAMHGYEPMTDEQRTEAAEWLRRLIAARRRGELDGPLGGGLRSIVQRLWYVQDGAVNELTDAELFDALTLDMYCTGCRCVTAHWRGVAKGGCTECHDIPKLQHEVRHWQDHLQVKLTPEARQRVQDYLEQAQQRLADAEQRAATLVADTDNEPWSEI